VVGKARWLLRDEGGLDTDFSGSLSESLRIEEAVSSTKKSRMLHRIAQ